MTAFSTDTNRWLKIGFLLPIVTLNGWVLIKIFQYFEPLVTVFIVAAVLAFILNYPVEFLQKKDIPRSYAVLMVLLVSLVSLVTLGITLLPALLEQISGILTQLPDWLNAATEKLQALQNWALAHGLPVNLNRIIGQLTDRFPEQIEGLGDETLVLTLNAVGGISSLLLTLVLTFYLLLDGKRVWDAIFRWLSPRHRDQIRRSLYNDFHSYFIGQAALGLIIGTLLSIVFFILKVPYSLLLGSFVGVMSLIPLGDMLSYLLICLFLATQSPGLALTTLVISVVLDQIVDQAIAPRILGGFTGLKPIWVIIALLLGTKLFGLPGLLIAVPMASFINTVMGDEPSPQNEPLNLSSEAGDGAGHGAPESINNYEDNPATPLN